MFNKQTESTDRFNLRPNRTSVLNVNSHGKYVQLPSDVTVPSTPTTSSIQPVSIAQQNPTGPTLPLHTKVTNASVSTQTSTSEAQPKPAIEHTGTPLLSADSTSDNVHKELRHLAARIDKMDRGLRKLVDWGHGMDTTIIGINSGIDSINGTVAVITNTLKSIQDEQQFLRNLILSVREARAELTATSEPLEKLSLNPTPPGNSSPAPADTTVDSLLALDVDTQTTLPIQPEAVPVPLQLWDDLASVVLPVVAETIGQNPGALPAGNEVISVDEKVKEAATVDFSTGGNQSEHVTTTPISGDQGGAPSVVQDDPSRLVDPAPPITPDGQAVNPPSATPSA